MLVDILKSIVGEGGWTTDADDLEPHLTEWRDTWRGRTPIMVSPDTTARVAEVVRVCNAAGTPIVPQGGNTGLCGGAIPDPDGSQVLLSLRRMNRIRSLDADDHTIVAEAGCTLSSIQSAAADADRFFPLSLAAEGTCQIGGNLSTNAGGINVLRYGTARAQALGLEVVLADGSTWHGLSALRKDTAGYDLKQVFIGSEGTLGIITAATLRLYPAVRHPKTALIGLQSPHRAAELLSALRYRLSDRIQAFELIPDRAMRFVARHFPEQKVPVLEHPWYVLLETAGDGSAETDEALMAAIESGLAGDAIVAKNRTEADALWNIRHTISEAQKREGASLKHDVSVPVSSVADFIEAATDAVTANLPGVRVVAFGHVGDGNVHFNLSQPADMEGQAFLERREPLAVTVYDVVSRFNGSISAEHGIGQAKKEHLVHYKSETEITLMRTLKAALDPDNLLNPGKVI
jgi:FAD/FMN-containing dehydrogenase